MYATTWRLHTLQVFHRRKKSKKIIQIICKILEQKYFQVFFFEKKFDNARVSLADMILYIYSFCRNAGKAVLLQNFQFVKISKIFHFFLLIYWKIEISQNNGSSPVEDPQSFKSFVCVCWNFIFRIVSSQLDTLVSD